MADVIDIGEIKKILPCSYSTLLVDRFCFESETKFVGLKNLTFNEEFFQGHFPVLPIFPGVLQVEAMNQVATIGLCKKMDPNGENEIYIKSIKKIKFRKPNNPGDRVLIEAEVVEFKDNEATIKATTKNNMGVTCQAQFVLAVRPRFIPTTMPKLYNEFDKSEDTYMDVNKIKALIPHRYPFLLIDYIVSSKDKHVQAVKNISYNEPFFNNYDNDYPVLTNSILCEIVAQAGCAYRLEQEEDEKLAFYLSIENATFHHPVRPGDQLVISVDIPNLTSKFGSGVGVIMVDDTKILDMSMKFAIVDPQ